MKSNNVRKSKESLILCTYTDGKIVPKVAANTGTHRFPIYRVIPTCSSIGGLEFACTAYGIYAEGVYV